MKLKEVVDYVADIIGYNAATSAVEALAQPAVDAAGAQLIGNAASCRAACCQRYMQWQQ